MKCKMLDDCLLSERYLNHSMKELGFCWTKPRHYAPCLCTVHVHSSCTNKLNLNSMINVVICDPGQGSSKGRTNTPGWQGRRRTAVWTLALEGTHFHISPWHDKAWQLFLSIQCTFPIPATSLDIKSSVTYLNTSHHAAEYHCKGPSELNMLKCI